MCGRQGIAGARLHWGSPSMSTTGGPSTNTRLGYVNRKKQSVKNGETDVLANRAKLHQISLIRTFTKRAGPEIWCRFAQRLVGRSAAEPPPLKVRGRGIPASAGMTVT